MRVLRTSAWDEQFFASWVELSQRLYDSTDYLAEELSDIRKVLGDPSYFPLDRWIALSAVENDKVCARGLVAVNANNPTVAKVGFLEFVEDPDLFRQFWIELEATARELGVTEIKGPIDLNFFIKYRWKTSGTIRPFFREPQQRAYYIEYFRHVGMLPVRTWETFRMSYWQSIRVYAQIRKAAQKKRPHLKVRVRNIDLDRFETELETLYHLLMKSFGRMSEFEPIPLETFKSVYLGFKVLIKSKFVSFAEYQGHTVGFCVNYFDPLHILLQRQRLLRWLPQTLANAWAYLRLKLNFRRLLIVYIGRVAGPNGEDFKGFQGAFTKKQTPWILLSLPELLSCYVDEDSPTRNGFQPQQIKTVATYALYGKKLK